jgi:hypothetical protein
MMLWPTPKLSAVACLNPIAAGVSAASLVVAQGL